LGPVISSISLSANPALIAANGFSTSNIDAFVKDQFLQPIFNKNVDFSIQSGDGDLSDGIDMGGGVERDDTDEDGKASVIYTAGTAAQEIWIRATAAQS